MMTGLWKWNRENTNNLKVAREINHIYLKSK